MRYRDRIKNLKENLKIHGFDGLIVSKKENIIYLSGFDGDDSLLIITKDENFIITDSRFQEKVHHEEFSDLTAEIASRPRHAVVDTIARKCKIKNLGFEAGHLSYYGYVKLKKALRRAALIPTRFLVEDLRIVKDADEIAAIKRTVAITRRVYSYAKKNIGPQLTGRRLAAMIDNSMRNMGAAGPAFQTIVAQNPYSSHPHAAATEEPFGKNSAVVIDMGALFDGYNSDLTRVLFLGRITTKFKRIYNILKAAQNLALDRIKPGIKISELDKAARQHIANKGFGKYFIHGLGHGIGLEEHELPKISSKVKGILRPGMVFTIEPGIYIEGWGGLRLEDMVLVTKDGCEVLTDDIPK